MGRPRRTLQRRQDLVQSLRLRLSESRVITAVKARAASGVSTPSYDPATARRMAAASDVAYFIQSPGGVTICPFYDEAAFQQVPATVTGGGINAALVGTTASEVVVAFRGTEPVTRETPRTFVTSLRDWLNDAQVRLIRADYTPGHVHRGFQESLSFLWNGVLQAVQQQHSDSGLPVVLTGHSKGGALARLAALRLQTETRITASAIYSYGAPRAGDGVFARDYPARIPFDWRFENTDDIVPHLPPTSAALDLIAASFVAPAAVPRLLTRDYSHVGMLEFLNWNGGITVGDSLLLLGQRTAHLAEIAAAGDVEQISSAHSLEQSYLPKL